MFSLTDIQPEPTDIGEILVKVRSEVAGGLHVMTSNFLVKFVLAIFQSVNFDISQFLVACHDDEEQYKRTIGGNLIFV